MEISRKLTVDAPVAEVWRILADEYANVGTWARAVSASAPNVAARPVNGSPVGGRVCTASFGDVIETIEVFDPALHKLAYTAQSKALPFFVREMRGTWTLTDHGAATGVDLGFRAELTPPFSVLMGWMMKRQFVTAIDQTLDDLKRFAETGEVHPDKAEVLAA